jgi:hypothetical protein
MVALIVKEIESLTKLFLVLEAAFATQKVIDMTLYRLFVFSLLRYDPFYVFLPYRVERISDNAVPLLTAVFR